MGIFSWRNKSSREEGSTKTPRASTDDRPMNRSASAKQPRGRSENINTSSGASVSAPSSPSRRYFSRNRNASREVFYTTDFEAPPIPQLPPFKYEAVPVPPRNPRRSSDYYSTRSIPAPPYENPVASRRKPTELGQSPPYYADSGYESNNGSYSALHSRAPSEHNYQEEVKQSNPRRSESDFLPELKLGEDTASLSQSINAARVPSAQKFDDSYFSRKAPQPESDPTVSPIDLDSDFKQPKSNRSSMQITKRTRFQDAPEMPTLDQLQNFHCASMTGSQKNAYMARDSEYGADVSSQIAATAGASAIRDGFSLDLPANESEFQTKYMDTSFTAPSEHVHSSSSVRRSTLSLPALSILEGFKVNKKGKILDEEGDPIGELVEGDLLDCVRQKANARGEVIDDYGRVVGIVRTIQTGSELPTPTGHLMSPPTMSPKQEAPPSVPVQPIRSAPLRPALSSRNYSAPSLGVAPQAAEVAQQAPAKLPPPITESPRSPRVEQPQSHVMQPELPLPVVRNETIEEPIRAHPPPQQSRSLEDLPEQVAPTSRDFAAEELPRRSAPSPSERSLSELSKPWAKPNMSPVPENDVAEEDAVPESPGLYTFKGEIPADDRPQREARSRSPHVAINAKAALALGQPNSAMFANVGSSGGPYGHGSRMGSRRATTHFTGSYSNGTLSVAPPNKPYRPSPLSSHETSPKRSDASDSHSEDGRNSYNYNNYNPSSRAPSVAASVYSVATSTSKPRTYFTHGGKVTVDSDADAETKSIKATAKAPAVPPIPKDVKGEKKKSRLSMSFGRKTVAK